MKKSLTVAGSDSGGGAGIQADLKTFAAHGVYGMSVITSVTAQNTLGVTDIFDVSPENISAQLDAVFTDLFPDSVKIGMVSSTEIIEIIAKKLTQYNAKNIVLDTVMVSTSGFRLLREEAVDALAALLFPIADIITPNIPEAEILCGFKIDDKSDMLRAAEVIRGKFSVPVLLKGGHLKNSGSDLLLADKPVWFESKKINNPNTHGTGCTLSSAIAANLALGQDIGDAVKNAKEYVTGALRFGLDLGGGSGPLNHMYRFF